MIETRRQEGFVLILTLVLIAALAFGAAMIGEWSSRALRDAIAARNEAATERAMLSARSNLIYQLTTSFLSVRGLELPDDLNSAQAMRQRANSDPLSGAQIVGPRLLRLDGRSYVYDDDLTISVQDARGLLNLNVFNEAELARLLAAYGVPPEVHQSLINRLLDYRETSDLPRLGGAKRQQYAEANRPPPPGQPLITPWQARAVLGWENYPRLWEDPGLPNLTSAGIVVGINVNTAPIDLLGAIFMIPAEQLSRLAQARESVVLHSSNDLRQFGATAASGDPMRYISFPSDTFIVTLQGRRAPIKSVISLALTPIGLTQPWRIDYALEIPFGSADAERTRENVARFPAVVSNPVAR
jgi:hypothetical protein